MKKELTLTDLVLGFVIIIAVLFFLSTTADRMDSDKGKAATEASILK